MIDVEAVLEPLARRGVTFRVDEDGEVLVKGFGELSADERVFVAKHREDVRAHLAGEAEPVEEVALAKIEEAEEEPPKRREPEREIVGHRGVAGTWVPIYKDEIEGQPYWGQGCHPIGTSSAMDRLRQQAQATASKLEKAKERRPDSGPAQWRTGR